MTQTIDTAPSVKSLAKMRALKVTGPDAAKFLQGQLTCDVLALAEGQATLGAYCDIKGKVRVLFQLQRRADEYFLLLPEELLETTSQDLQKYAVFSKVKLAVSENDINMPVGYVDDESAILAKIPQIYFPTVGLFFPHDLNLPALGAVSFTKGCYRGQEIVARMQYRGNLKRHLQSFEIVQPASLALVMPGTIITAEQDTAQVQAGTVVRATQRKDGGIIGLAVVSDACLGSVLSIKQITLNVQVG